MTSLFAAATDDDLALLVAEMPLCWIVPHAEPAAAILMPVLLERDGQGQSASLLGHLPRAAPAAAVLADAPRASFLFLGPNAYVSPQVAGRQDWAPTWNFASARIEAAVTIDPALTRSAVEGIVAHMEGAGGWRVDALGRRYEDLLARIVGFRAAIADTAPRLKLGQDEEPAVRARIADALGDTPLGRWSRHAARD